ncbi:hypothetical protein FPQ18DRAFT_365510 [Pyronema domesticum]|nr:hypothetical protein FPQ18DRAFT_365510 [Pyronema domesticum]
MMEQLAERRMAREEEANNANGTIQRDSNMHHHPHNHVAPTDYDEDEEDDDEYEDDEDYDDEDDEEEEPDTMTEEQRMEEGRRMFQIFAARMFEQRVLTAYREKVSRERQRKLLEELEEEELRKQEREEKKAKDKDKKKEKKRALKQSKEEERLRKEAERKEEEEKQKAIDARKAEEQKRRKEELRLKREAEKKAAEEERQRKEEERKKRQQEEKEREAEKERKRKEHQERERKKKEEAAKKAKEEKEAREKEAREKREREEREKKEREAKAKKEAAEKEKKRKEDEAKTRAEAAAQAAKRAQAFSQQPPITTTAPPPGYGSPHIPVVTPATPKQTTAAQLQRPRGSSQQGSMQGSQCSSPKTPNIGPRLGGSGSPSTPILQQNMPGPMPVKGFHYQGFPQTSPMPHHIGPPPGVNPPDMFNMSPLGGMNGPSPMQPFMTGMPQRQSIGNGIPMMPSGQMPFAHGPSYPRGFSNGLPMPMQQPPGMRPISSQGRGLFMQDVPMHPPPGVPYPPPGSPFINRAVDPIIMPSMGSHNRIPSGSFDSPHRQPAPIARPSSVAPTRASDEGVEEISKVMGSRALLEDDDEPLPENMSPARRVSAPFAPRPIRGVPSSNLFGDSLGSFSDFGAGASWTNPLPLSGPGSLGASGVLSGSLPSAWANKAGWSDIDATYNRRRTTKVDNIRLIACKKWGELSGPHGAPVELLSLQRSVAQDAPPELQFRPEELGSTLDIEGDAQNGGGSFEQKYDNGRILVYFSPSQMTRQLRPGEIGSPSTSGATPFKSSIAAPPGMTHPTVHPAGY